MTWPLFLTEDHAHLEDVVSVCSGLLQVQSVSFDAKVRVATMIIDVQLLFRRTKQKVLH